VAAAGVAAGGDGSASGGALDGTIKPGKISGDVSAYLCRWYRQVFRAELLRVLPQLKSRAPLPLVGLRVTPMEGGEFDLATPILRIVADGGAGGATAVPASATGGRSPHGHPSSPPLVLSPAELHCVEAYFAQRVLAPPFQTDACVAFARVFALPSSSAATNMANGGSPVAAPNGPQSSSPEALATACEAARALIQLWALELLQARPFPQPHQMFVLNRALLESLLTPSAAESTAGTAGSPAVLSFRLSPQVRPELDAEAHLLTLTIECAEPPDCWLLDEQQRRSQPDSDGADLFVQQPPALLLLPIVWDLHHKRFGRWEGTGTERTQRVFCPLGVGGFSFASLVDGVRWLLQQRPKQLLTALTRSA